jgi:hypothetical protein
MESGRRREATRQRRAHPTGSACSGERTRGGATLLLQLTGAVVVLDSGVAYAERDGEEE